MSRLFVIGWKLQSAERVTASMCKERISDSGAIPEALIAASKPACCGRSRYALVFKKSRDICMACTRL